MVTIQLAESQKGAVLCLTQCKFVKLSDRIGGTVLVELISGEGPGGQKTIGSTFYLEGKLKVGIIEDPSFPLKDAPINKNLRLLNLNGCQLQKISGRIGRKGVQVKLLSGEGPQRQKPGSEFFLPSRELVTRWIR